jgi:hypothetical protein
MSLDPYPTDEELEKVRLWPPHLGFAPLMNYVKSLWWQADWGWSQRGNTYYVSTGGWSGNEDLIEALRLNRLFWTVCWRSSRRGGHYRFCIPKWAKPTKGER